MCRLPLFLASLASICWNSPPAAAQGLLLPRDRSIAPMTLVNQRVQVNLNDQVAQTTVKQVFRNPANRPLEATYIFTVPRGALVKDFSMIVNGRKTKGELVEAPKAKAIYTEIVRRTMDPGLLEYIGTDILQMSVFPVPAHGEQEVEVSFTSLTTKQDNTVEYHFPLRTQSGALRVQGEFSFEMDLKSTKAIQNIYSPTHPISFVRKSDHHATISFDKSLAVLDRDLQLFYTTGKDDVGMTVLQHKADGKDGYFLLLLAPRGDLSADQRVPRDMVFVLDTSGSMREDGKIEQAKRALKYGLDSLKPGDRFAVLQFATTVNAWQSELVEASPEQIADGKKWVQNLETTGGTAIQDALQAALQFHRHDRSRNFTLVFITDGKPTVGETNVENILKKFNQDAKPNTRVFTFGVGYDLDAAFLDRLAEKHKGTSTFVRPSEDMEMKVSHFFNQIHQPVLTDLTLETEKGPRLLDIYPPHLPDLFHGGQLVVLGRYQGSGKGILRLSGRVGDAKKEFKYDISWQRRTDNKPYVEDLWARRKVGYLLDQVRLGGEKKEIMDEIIALAKKYGIATPYTSYLVIPDDVPHRWDRRPTPLSSAPDGGAYHLSLGTSGAGGRSGSSTRQLEEDSLKKVVDEGLAKSRSEALVKTVPPGIAQAGKGISAGAQLQNLDAARVAFSEGKLAQTQQDQAGVELAMTLNQLKNQSQVTRSAQRQVQTRNCVELNGVWVDDQFKKETPRLEIKAMSNAYFKILELRPELKEVFQLGNSLVWIAPSGTAIIVSPFEGRDEVTTEEVDRLFKKN